MSPHFPTSLCSGIKTLNMGTASTRWFLPRQNLDFTWDVSTVNSSDKPALCCQRDVSCAAVPARNTHRLHAGIHPSLFFHLVSCCHSSELRSAGKSPGTSSQSTVYFSISILTTFYNTHQSMRYLIRCTQLLCAGDICIFTCESFSRRPVVNVK